MRPTLIGIIQTSSTNRIECHRSLVCKILTFERTDERADIHVNIERVRERFLGDVRADRSRALSERTLVDLSPSIRGKIKSDKNWTIPIELQKIVTYPICTLLLPEPWHAENTTRAHLLADKTTSWCADLINAIASNIDSTQFLLLLSLELPTLDTMRTRRRIPSWQYHVFLFRPWWKKGEGRNKVGRKCWVPSLPPFLTYLLSPSLMPIYVIAYSRRPFSFSAVAAAFLGTQHYS